MPKVRSKAYVRGERITVSISSSASEGVLELINSFNSLSSTTIQILENKAQLIYGKSNKKLSDFEDYSEKKEDKKIYVRGDKYNIVIPKEASEELMKWINTRKFVSPQIIETLEEVAVEIEKKVANINV